jgi:2-dehydropantoate 2-reductase
MKTLVYGAGVLGSLYAAVLKNAGKEVTLLARGKRLEELKEHGLIIENLLEEKTINTKIDLIENKLSEKDDFDLILVVMQKNHVQSILPDLAKYSTNATVVILGNNGTGIEEYKDILDAQRIILGFPGAAGKRDGYVMRVVFDSEKSNITMGELSGEVTPRIQKIKKFLESAKIPVKLSENIDAWLKVHIALISPLANVYFYLKNQNKTMAEAPQGVEMATNAIIEGVKVLKKLGYPILPKKFRLILLFPRKLKKIIGDLHKGKWYDVALKSHAEYAKTEMRRIADEFQVLVKKAGISTPNINQLYEFAPN